MAQIDAFFRMLDSHGGSDLHLSSGSQPVIRLNGRLERVRYKPLEHEELRKLLYEITPEDKVKTFEETGDVDFGYEVPGLARYRANYFRQNRGISAAFRQIPTNIKTIDDLGLPRMLKDLAMLPKGLVLVTGPTGSGKSTTLAAMIDHCNANRREHIITIEDPIEFVHESRGCLIQQREVGRDTKSFATALRGALREDPDILLVGEMRDLETIGLAIKAAETGHLVFATLHTSSAAKTVDRIVEVFPPEEQAQIRSSLADCLSAVISQVLLRRRDGAGRALAMELLISNPAVRNLIRERKTFLLGSVLQTSKDKGMICLDEELVRLIDNGTVDPVETQEYFNDKALLEKSLCAASQGRESLAS